MSRLQALKFALLQKDTNTHLTKQFPSPRNLSASIEIEMIGSIMHSAPPTPKTRNPDFISMELADDCKMECKKISALTAKTIDMGNQSKIQKAYKASPKHCNPETVLQTLFNAK